METSWRINKQLSKATRLSSVHHPPPPFAFSSKYLLLLSLSVQYAVSNLNFQLVQFPIAFQKWKKYRGGEPATDKQSSRKTRTTAYFPACSPHFVSEAYGERREGGCGRTICGVRPRNKVSAFASHRLHPPPHLSTPWESCSFPSISCLSFLYFCPGLVFSFTRLRDRFWISPR